MFKTLGLLTLVISAFVGGNNISSLKGGDHITFDNVSEYCSPSFVRDTHYNSLVNLSHQDIVSNESYAFDLKEDYLYNTSVQNPTVDDCAIGFNYNAIIYGDFVYKISYNGDWQTFYANSLQFNSTLNGGVYKIFQITLGWDNLYNQYGRYSIDVFFANVGTVQCSEYSFIGDNIQIDQHGYSYLSRFVDVYRNDESFKFNADFNYNAPYNALGSDTFVISNDFPNSNSQKWVDINVGLFESNGQLFDTIRLSYYSAMASGFLDGSGTYHVNQTTNTGYWQFMMYKNTQSNYSVIVANRKQGTISDGDTQKGYIANGILWTNPQYQYLDIFSTLTVDVSNSLAKFNDSSSNSGIVVNYYGGSEGYLSSAFDLVNMGFSGLASLMGITVLPMITLGTLVMIPFLITLLIFIVKLFKR